MHFSEVQLEVTSHFGLIIRGFFTVFVVWFYLNRALFIVIFKFLRIYNIHTLGLTVVCIFGICSVCRLKHDY